MKTDFAKYLTSFFVEYLSGERGVSPNTIRSYSNTFTLLLGYMDEVKHVKADRLKMEQITRGVVLDFLNWLQNSRQNGNTTGNQRLAAAYIDIIPVSKDGGSWEKDSRLKAWLKDLGK
ncbi:MAG: site-specific integrase [Tannerella sp.]|jgi:site-specific recombinase XerD|nr:site-specific integrase [Tannerella sp.]